MYRGTTAAYVNPVSDDVQTRVRLDVVTSVSARFAFLGRAKRAPSPSIGRTRPGRWRPNPTVTLRARSARWVTVQRRPHRERTCRSGPGRPGQMQPIGAPFPDRGRSGTRG